MSMLSKPDKAQYTENEVAKELGVSVDHLRVPDPGTSDAQR